MSTPPPTDPTAAQVPHIKKRTTRRRQSVSESPIPSKRPNLRPANPPTHTPGVPGYFLRSLGEDGTFYLPGEIRPTAPPSSKQTATHTPPLLYTQLGDLRNEALEVTTRIVDELYPLSPDHPASYAQIHFFTTVDGHSIKYVDTLAKIAQIADNKAACYTGRSKRLRDRAERFRTLRQLIDNHEEARAYVFRSTLTYLSHKRSHPNHVVEIHTAASSKRASLNKTRDGGEACRKTFSWVGLKRLAPTELSALTDKLMVETEELVEIGKSHGVLKDSPNSSGVPNFVKLEGRGFYRVCAPVPGQTNHATGAIFWEKEDDDDITPTSDKILGAVVYSPDLINKAFSPDEEYSEIEILINQEHLLEKANVDRQRLLNGGKMAKGRGAQSIFGMPYFMKLPDDQKFYNGNVKIPVQALETFIESRHEAFLEGFLPEFAAERKSAAQRAHLINQLGFPSTSTFVTYGYAASAHLDNDACPTSGWVTHRPVSLHRFTSNFVWASHGLVVELAPNAFWFWRARDHAHGTTVHEDILTTPNLNYTKGHIKKYPGASQVTRASVLSEAVCKAHSR